MNLDLLIEKQQELIDAQNKLLAQYQNASLSQLSETITEMNNKKLLTSQSTLKDLVVFVAKKGK